MLLSQILSDYGNNLERVVARGSLAMKRFNHSFRYDTGANLLALSKRGVEVVRINPTLINPINDS